MTKKYIEVLAKFHNDGKIVPLAFINENGSKYAISRVTDITKAASMRLGGLGIRYTCYIGNRMFYLFLEDNKWFLDM